jgi:hypothetical protein
MGGQRGTIFRVLEVSISNGQAKPSMDDPGTDDFRQTRGRH